jgi:hypothetical protein
VFRYNSAPTALVAKFSISFFYANLLGDPGMNILAGKVGALTSAIIIPFIQVR